MKEWERANRESGMFKSQPIVQPFPYEKKRILFDGASSTTGFYEVPADQPFQMKVTYDVGTTATCHALSMRGMQSKNS